MVIRSKARESLTDLPSGRALAPEEANETTRASVTRVIVPAGPADVGKTTLLAEIYERFLEGPFAGLRFAWSRTLHGFEQRAHHARIASHRATPTTLRTPMTDSDAFLHLRLAAVDAVTPPRDVLIADWPGEVFREMRDDVEAARSHALLPRADHISFLVNGENLGDRRLRQVAHHETDMLIQSVLDAGIDRATVSVVYTKWDAALNGDGACELDRFVETFETELRRKHGARLRGLHFVRTAARPLRGSSVERGFNLDQVLRMWLGRARQRTEGRVLPGVRAIREFDRFRALRPQ